jgi:hypothetical protein
LSAFSLEPGSPHALEVRAERVESGVAKLDSRVARLEAGQAKVLAGVQTIIGLLDKENGDLPD